ncbi:MAG: sigma-70 family RNA polymerase sigma factor [Ideonella sp.]|nr:sigma-70 family RNA polymerase sigma factor [Ideonella sp.]
MDSDDDLMELVVGCRAGDNAAWAALVQRFQRLVYAVVCRMGLDEHDAADVFQTVFERLQKHLPTLKDPARLRAWVVTTAKREGLLQRQRARRMVSMTVVESDDGLGLGEWDVPDEALVPEQLLSHLQQLDRLRQAIEQLEPRSRRMIELLFSDEDQRLPYEDIARQLGMPTGSLGPTRQRCLDRLRRILTAA